MTHGARRGVLLLVAACAVPCAGAADGWRSAADVSLQTSIEHFGLAHDSVLNPDNRYARLPRRLITAEARANLSIADDRLRLSLRPILAYQRRDDGDTVPASGAGYLSQWQLRARFASNLALAVGRELMNWGPGQFRSPASPFYFENGRSNPARELSGVDALKLAWTPTSNAVLSLAFVEDRGHASSDGDVWRRTWLARAEMRGDDWNGALILAKPAGRGAFAGAHALWSINDDWNIYGEAASSTQARALISPADASRPFALQAESGRHAVALLGASANFTAGDSLSVEYLYNGHGYARGQQRAYFERAAANAGAAALALQFAPPLTGRHYLHLLWQTNPLGEGSYWRLMLSRNLQDGGNEWAAYVDQPLSGHLSVYAIAMIADGGPRREFGAVVAHSLTLGIRLALP